MVEVQDTAVNALQRMRDRDAEMCVLRQRISLLLGTPDKDSLARHRVEDAKSLGDDSRVGSSVSSASSSPSTPLSSREALKARLEALCRSRELAARISDKAVVHPSPVSSSDSYPGALESLLSHPPAGSATLSKRLPSSRKPRSQAQPSTPTSELAGPVNLGALRRNGGGDGDGPVTYRGFLERLNRPESKGFVSAIRLFLFSIFGPGGDAPMSAQPQARDWALEKDELRVEVYGASFLVERCAEFFLAMQNAMGVHPSWAGIGYDNIVACREHLERFVMTKIHPFAFGSKLDGYSDSAVSDRLQALQFLTPDDLNVEARARDETVLALAQGELRKMGSGQCPGDMVTRVVKCCDIIFALLDQGRRLEHRVHKKTSKAWRPDLDPASTADDFLPVLIYVVLQANVPRLHSMCEYVQAFHSPVALMSRPGYCFVALRSAVEFLMNLDGAAVGLSEEEFLRGMQLRDVTCVCIGSGRFLRAVLVPVIHGLGGRTIVAQPRGSSFLKAMLLDRESRARNGQHVRDSEMKTGDEYEHRYEVDTVEFNGEVVTESYPLHAVGTLGSPEGLSSFLAFPAHLPNLKFIGVGVTEAGVSRGSGAMAALHAFLRACYSSAEDEGTAVSQPRRLSVINTDNLPCNGDAIRGIMRELCEEQGADKAFLQWMEDCVCFHNTMVDRITSHRAGDPLTPRAEPLPPKALVVEDLRGVLPLAMARTKGVVVRKSAGRIEVDHAMKLRVSNATHTAMVYLMALSGMKDTSSCIGHPLIMPYLRRLFRADIGHRLSRELGVPLSEVEAVWEDWAKRLIHPAFGLSTMFVAQNAFQKLGIRLLPSVRAAVRERSTPSRFMAFAVAALLRFLTPTPAPASASSSSSSSSSSSPSGLRVGTFLGAMDASVLTAADGDCVYAGDLTANFRDGTYRFLDPSGAASDLLDAAGEEEGRIRIKGQAKVTVGRLLSRCGPSGQGLDLSDPLAIAFCGDVARLYVRMLPTAPRALSSPIGEASKPWPAGGESAMSVLGALLGAGGAVSNGSAMGEGLPEGGKAFAPTPLHVDEIEEAVVDEVMKVEAVDLHTHLFPPEHGRLMLWGVDELLTYHYLVAEYFMTADGAKCEEPRYSWDALIWRFDCNRYLLPPSSEYVRLPTLHDIQTQGMAMVTPEAFFELAKEAQAELVWKALFLDRSPLSEAAKGVLTTLKILGLEEEVETRDLQAVRRWFKEQEEDKEAYVERVFHQARVRYCVMTNVPFDEEEAKHWRPHAKTYSHRFRSALRVDPLLKGDWLGVSKALKLAGYPVSAEGAKQFLRDWAETMKPEYFMASTPHKFKLGVATNADEGDGAPPDLLREVLIPLAEELDLPLALKLGAHRGLNPRLRSGGDGVEVMDLGWLETLCGAFPRVKFLITVLSTENQHQACVMANKFGNLHLYGCWWYCNNPSLIAAITAMRVEMLGTAFTAQHSDARILEQLLYKWQHSREIISRVLVGEYVKLARTGWGVSRDEIQRDVHRLFGGCYEEFMTKKLV